MYSCYELKPPSAYTSGNPRMRQPCQWMLIKALPPCLLESDKREFRVWVYFYSFIQIQNLFKRRRRQQTLRWISTEQQHWSKWLAWKSSLFQAKVPCLFTYFKLQLNFRFVAPIHCISQTWAVKLLNRSKEIHRSRKLLPPLVDAKPHRMKANWLTIKENERCKWTKMPISFQHKKTSDTDK